MADVFLKAKRSEIMASIKSRGNRSTEWRLRARLIAAGMTGWRVSTKDIVGKPDFAFDAQKLAIFVDGCFWHGCRRCKTIPATNRSFWLDKIEGNRKRDRKVTRLLRQEGWTVVRFWEHEMRKAPGKCLQKTYSALKLSDK